MQTEDFELIAGFDPAGKSRSELERTIAACGDLASFTAAKKLACLAELQTLGDDGVPPADIHRVKTRSSTRKAKRAARTASQLPAMPAIRSALERGDISEEHADAAADAAARVSPEEADEELVRLATRLPADRFAREAHEWAGKREADDATETRQQQARRERSGRVWRKHNGRIGIHGELDAVAGEPVLKAWEREMNTLFTEDGGRDADPASARTYDQRGADALANLITAPAAAGPKKRPHPRYMTHLRVDVERCSDDPNGVAAFLDGSPLPQSALERIACESAFVGAIYGADGAILWQGRSTRLATDDQWAALIDRDGGCVHCGADPSKCQAHHLVPWAPPTFGETDIDELVLVCDAAHNLIHHHGHEVAVEADGRYVIVPPGARDGPHLRAA